MCVSLNLFKYFLLSVSRKEIGNLLKEREEVIRNLNARKNLARQQQDQEEVRSLVEQNKALDKEMEKERECQKKLQTEVFFSLIFLFLLIFGQTKHSLCHWSVLCIDIEHGDEIGRDQKRGGR